MSDISFPYIKRLGDPRVRLNDTAAAQDIFHDRKSMCNVQADNLVTRSSVTSSHEGDLGVGFMPLRTWKS